RERFRVGQDRAAAADQDAQTHRRAGGAEEAIRADRARLLGAFAVGPHVGERPVRLGSGRFGGDDHVAVVVDGEAGARRSAGAAGHLDRAAAARRPPARRPGRFARREQVATGVAGEAGAGDAVDRLQDAPGRRPHHTPGGGPAGRVGRTDEFAVGARGDAEGRRAAGDRAQVELFAKVGFLPGADATGRIGRGEDLAGIGPPAGDGDAQRFGRAGDAVEVDVAAGRLQFGDGPGRGRPGRVGARVDLAERGDRYAEVGRGAGDALHLAIRDHRDAVDRVFVATFAGVDGVPGARPAGRVGR